MANAERRFSFKGVARSVKRSLIPRSFLSGVGVVLRYLIIAGICYVILFPLIGKFSTSLMTRFDVWDQTVSFIPKYPTLNNYKLAWEFMKYPTAFLNSLKLALLVSVTQLAACTIVAYGFARFEFRGKGFWFALVILSLVIPPELISTPLYLNFRFFTAWGIIPEPGLNLLGTIWPFLLTSMTATGVKNGLFIYILRQMFAGLPKELEEAAYVDGAGPLRTFWQVMVPSAVPGMVVVFLFAFVWQWNDYYLVTMYMRNQTVLPVMLENLAAAVLGDQWRQAPEEASLLNSAGGVMIIAPVLVLYAFMQRHFVESVERTGIVG
ncbi:MAG: carbohydrate ABC transporter permease [Bacillota bacterium]|nr:carbohydrate ABC transporter permease [Bacillota bacterium]